MAVIEASVEFDYTAQEADELTLKKGDLITGIRVQSGGWWEGTLVRENKRGMFPDNFVRVLGEAAADTTVVMRKRPGRKCRVLFSYAPANADELELHVDDVIDVLSEVEEGWWRGRLRNKTGVFPSNFVEEMDVEEVTRESNNNEEGLKSAATIVDVMPPEVPTSPIPSAEVKQEEGGVVEENVNTVEVITSASSTTIPCLPPKPVRERCKVLYPYDAQNEDELTLKEEDILILISREAPDKGWWRGELNGRTGLFPDNFVTVLPGTEEPSIKSEKPASGNKSTTNRTRDSITKPGEATTAALRKSLDLSTKKDDEIKPSPVQNTPPVAFKQKPAPPIKKPSRSPPSNITPTSPNLSKHSMKFSLPIPPPPTTAPGDNAVISTTNTTVLPVSDSTSSNNNNKTQISIPSSNSMHEPPSDSHDGSCISRSGSYSVTNVNCNSQPSIISAIVNNHHDSIQSNSITTRRGSTSDNERRASVGATVGAGAQSSDSELEERPVSGAKLTHLTANRARAPRRRPPSTIISKEESQELSTMMNGSAEPHIVEKIVNKMSPTPPVPWVEELKMNQAKKNSAAQGKTRVTIGPFNSTTTSSSGTSQVEPVPASKPASVGVVFRSQRPASMFATEPPSQPSSGPALVRNNSTATCNKPTSVAPSPVSGAPSPSGPPSCNKPPLTSAISPSAKPPQHPPPAATEVISVTHKQWSELVEKINKLESIIESQSALISELSKKVKSGQDKQSIMQNEMDKLMELVTQV